MKIGIRSRSIHLFLRDEVHLSGRDQIYNLVLKEIHENPIMGIGIAGDRRIIGTGYAHNIFIEILGNFGLIVGRILIVVLLVLIVKSLFRRDKQYTNLVVIWLSLGFFHLMISGTYLTNIKFWILLGLLFNKMNKSYYKNSHTPIIDSFEEDIQ